jgi:hypothetical protein
MGKPRRAPTKAILKHRHKGGCGKIYLARAAAENYNAVLGGLPH